MDNYKIEKIKKCLENVENEIAQENNIDVNEIHNRLQRITEIRDMLDNMEIVSFDEWCNTWWGENVYANGSWENPFRIYIFKKYLKKNDVYFNVKASIEDGKMAETLANKLREMNKLDVRVTNDENCISIVGIFDILQEKRVKDIIGEFCKEYPDIEEYINFYHT